MSVGLLVLLLRFAEEEMGDKKFGSALVFIKDVILPRLVCALDGQLQATTQKETSEKNLIVSLVDESVGNIAEAVAMWSPLRIEEAAQDLERFASNLLDLLIAMDTGMTATATSFMKSLKVARTPRATFRHTH